MKCSVFSVLSKHCRWTVWKQRCQFLAWVLESGRSHGSVPFRRNSAILALSLWARTMVRGIHSSVSSVAYPNIRPCQVQSQITTWIDITILYYHHICGSTYPAVDQTQTETWEPSDLVAGSHVFFLSIQVNTLSNVRGLLLQSHQYIAGLIVEACRTK